MTETVPASRSALALAIRLFDFSCGAVARGR